MIVIDGIVYSLQKHGGISVYYHHLLKFLKRHGIQTMLTQEVPTMQDVSEASDTISCIFRDSRFMERYRKCRLPPEAQVFHSSYYRKPDVHGVPNVVTVHDFIYERHQRGIRRMVHSLQKAVAIRAAQTVICVSESTRKDLTHYIGEVPGQNVVVIHNGVSKTFHPLGDLSPPKPYVLFVGERNGYKNFKLAARAMTFLADLDLICVGGGKLSEREVAGLPAQTSGRIKHAGYVDDQSLNRLYNEAVCLLYLSSYEGFGIPVIEAMRAGCPVVSLNCDAVVEVGGEALTIVPVSDPKAVAEGVNLTRSSVRTEIVARGMAISSRYDWETTHRQTLEVYRSLL